VDWDSTLSQYKYLVLRMDAGSGVGLNSIRVVMLEACELGTANCRFGISDICRAKNLFLPQMKSYLPPSPSMSMPPPGLPCLLRKPLTWLTILTAARPGELRAPSYSKCTDPMFRTLKAFRQIFSTKKNFLTFCIENIPLLYSNHGEFRGLPKFIFELRSTAALVN
jgi:hypothetical protein